MKLNGSKLQKCQTSLVRYAHTAGRFLRNFGRSRPAPRDVDPHAFADEPPAPRLNPLERITEHLRRLGLGQQVRVRFEAASRDFVLEDADGVVHAKDCDQAVVLIERIWLYER